ncbi:hypothetical protein [Streptomyces ossamyceticus]|jgi:hypothetical protein|uniref:hypothetical protein n=1 Tax=Streptomyces ossamyceticus TaxID=249581 RepID=UPI000AC0105C|nr:hypothetical protein [Streptomyces ossamyceticus]
MSAVVYRGARTHEIEIRAAEASALAKERDGRGVSTLAPDRIATGAVVVPVDGGRSGR